MARIEELLAAEKNLLGRRQQQGVGTYLRDAIDKLDGVATAELIALRTRTYRNRPAGGDEKGVGDANSGTVVTKI